MGYDLYREGDYEGEQDYFRWNVWGFPPVRYLGELYGWQPMGTKLDAWFDDDGKEYPEQLDVGYSTNDGQIVCAEDANNWAIALERALVDLESKPVVDFDSKSNRIDDAYMKNREQIHNPSAPHHKEALHGEFNTVEEQNRLKRFIVFLKDGAFNIY